MLALNTMPPSFEAWNRRHGAPHGRTIRGSRFLKNLLPEPVYLRARGPFSIQPNNTTRRFEYPWAFHAARPRPRMRVVEIGGGLSGFQFALDKAGCSVVNVDPGLEARGVGWPCDKNSMQHLNRVFGTNVELRNCTVEHADLEPAGYDMAFSLSVIEHIPDDEALDVMRRVFDCLKPNGLFILTVDLFLDLFPFTERSHNAYGTNMDLYRLCQEAPFEMLVGRPDELYGFPQFKAARVAMDRDHYLSGTYPVLVQCLVLRKPDR